MKFSHIKASDEELRVALEAGFILREMSRLDAAEEVFRGVSDLVPQSDVPRVALGTILLQRGQFAEAREVYEEVLQQHPASLYARVHRAEAMLFQGEREAAEAELQQIIRTDGDSPHTRTARTLLDAADIICAREPANSV